MIIKDILKQALALTIMSLAINCNAFGQVAKSPKHEVRAVWLTTLKNLDWPKTFARDQRSIEKQKKELCDILDEYQKANINTVLFQVVDRASTIYPSAIEPWDACMTGRFGGNPGYDPLAFAVNECHKRGMEIQAWIATLPVGPYNGLAAKRLRKQGYKMFKFEADAFLDPSSPSTGDLVASLAREITTHYDVDGIHLDYIRYPEMLPAPKNEYIAQWRRSKITDIVRKVHDAVKAEKPYVKISCSPIGKYSDLSRYSSNNWNARDRVSQDAQLWLRLGLMDQLYPMMYFRGNNFYPFAADWAENSYGKSIAAGLGTYFLDPREGGKYGWTLSDITREMMVARWLGLGTAHFRSRFLTSNYQGIYDFSANAYGQSPALIPPMTWISSNKPASPDKIQVKDGILTIIGSPSNDRNKVFYNVYASDSWPVDMTDASNLILQRYSSDIVYLSKNAKWQPQYFAVTTMDRYGNESDPVQSWRPPKPAKGQLECNGSIVKVPFSLIKGFYNSKGHFVATDAEGQTIRKLRHAKGSDDELSVNVEGLQNGFYILNYISKYNKKKTSKVRFGFFLIKRRFARSA